MGTKTIFHVFFVIISFVTHGQIDSIGSGHSIRFNGSTDYIVLGDHFHQLNLPFSVSAWIYLDQGTGTGGPIFVTNDNSPNYRGFWFTVTSSVILCEFGDGTGGDNPAFRRGKVASIQNVLGRWVHVCAVMESPFNITLYLNGIDVGGSSSGGSNLPMASSLNGDIAKIGYFLSNGVTYFFNGQIDEVRLWDRAITSIEVKQTMCRKLTGTETGLIGYWNFNEISGTSVLDKSVNKFTGQFQGNPQRGFSGAPIGDQSNYLYTSNWSGTTIPMTDGTDQVIVSNVQGNPEGVHTYEVKNPPSQTAGLNSTNLGSPYFGAFVASLDIGNSFDITYNFQGSSSCSLFTRANNAVSTWVNSSNPATNVLQQIEAIKVAGQKINFDLGPDQVLCNQTTSILSTGLSGPNLTFLWSNGMDTPSIQISQSGEYGVKVSGACGSVKDSVKIIFASPPPSFSLGADQALCEIKPFKLTPLASPGGYEFSWQDGSHESSFTVTAVGKYWVEIKNECGVESDTINITKPDVNAFELPNVITPNSDGKNDFYKVPEEFLGFINLEIFNRWGKKVFQSNNYMNDWGGGDLEPGVYYLLLTGSCIDRVKDTLTILK